MIRLAQASDAGLILGYLQDIPNPVNLERHHVADILTHPDRITMIDDVTNAVASIAFSATRRSPTRIGALPGIVDIPWLLPRASWTVNNVDDIAWVLVHALEQLVAARAAARLWPCGGEFEGDQVVDPVGRLQKSREIGQFWGARYGLTIDVLDLHGVARSEAATVQHLITQFRAYFLVHPHG